MGISEDISLSRLKATAASLGPHAADAAGFFEKPVLLTGERDTLSTRNGQECFSVALRLLVRMMANLTVDVSQHPNADVVRHLVKEYQIHNVLLTEATPDLAKFTGVLNIGRDSANSSVVAVNSNGWIARISSNGRVIPADCSQYNPLGACAAASLGVSEVFKRLIKLRPGRGEPLEGYEFSFWDYSVGGSAGPSIESLDSRPLMLAGAGAIGSCVAYLLNVVGVGSEVHVVDPQRFRRENLGTCLTMRPIDDGEEKAKVIASHLAGGRPFVGEINDFRRQANAPAVTMPDIVIGALDNIDARRDLQQMWPLIAIDGAIGPVSCEVTLHPWGPDLSCLLCDFERPSHPALASQSRSTGLSPDRIGDATAVVNARDVENAPIEKRAWLAERVGKDVCSVVSEAELAKLAEEKQREGFRPSVPFVACLSAVMVVTEVVRWFMKAPAMLTTGFQFDVLVGPHNGIRKDHQRKRSCLCVERRAVIERLRAKREQ
jgi:hypothetical protein